MTGRLRLITYAVLAATWLEGVLMFVRYRPGVRWLLPMLIGLGAVPLAAQPLSPEQMTAIDTAAAKALGDTGVPAASIAIVRDGSIVYTKAYGFERSGEPARADARYAIGSTSKQFTATAVLMLADAGKLSLDDKVGKYLPDLTRANEITIRQLLTHTAGYRDYWPQDYLFEAMTRPTTAAAILDKWAKAPLDFEPGTRWQYSNTGYVAAGRIVELVSRQTLFAFLRDHVFARIGMTPIEYDQDVGQGEAPGYDRNGFGPVRATVRTGAGWSFAAGELVMTAADLARWDISVINRSLMTAAAYNAQQREAVLANGVGSQYGLGVFVRTSAGRRLIEHGGGATGYLAENRIYPDDRTAIVVLDNAGFGNAQVAIADAIEQVVFAETRGIVRAKALYSMVRSDRFDHAAFTQNGNFYFTSQMLAEYRSSLAALKTPDTVVQTQSGVRGGFTVERFIFTFGSRSLEVTLRAEPGPRGRIEEFVVSPIS